MTATPGGLVVDSLLTQGDSQSIIPSGTGQTQIWDIASGTRSGDALGGGSIQSGASTVTMSWTQQVDQDWTLAAVPLNAAPTPPVITSPGTQNTNENTSLVFSSGNGNPIAITDPAGGSDQITLGVSNGTLTLAGTTGLTFTVGDGTDDPTMTFSGTVAAINTALNGLSYTPNSNYVGSDALTMADMGSELLSLNIDTSLVGYYTFQSTSDLGTDTSPAAANNATNYGGTSFDDPMRGEVLSLAGGAYEKSPGCSAIRTI